MSPDDINTAVMNSLANIKTKVETFRQREKARQDHARNEERERTLATVAKAKSVAKAVQPRANVAARATVDQPRAKPVAAAQGTVKVLARKRPSPDTDDGGTVAVAKKPNNNIMEVNMDSMAVLRDSLVLSANSLGKASQFLEELNKILKDQQSVQQVAKKMIDETILANALQFASSSKL